MTKSEKPTSDFVNKLEKQIKQPQHEIPEATSSFQIPQISRVCWTTMRLIQLQAQQPELPQTKKLGFPLDKKIIKETSKISDDVSLHKKVSNETEKPKSKSKSSSAPIPVAYFPMNSYLSRL
ncbi:unnamed protein product [Dovyalis caffra]|uniref:Uncharacterized protein n=1 Tax=Dovyalis caffra TaxID=77055 RepID=A0AAV1REC7_9ROSI|nr:unnamed protein product [Dovyalis caffra]